MKHSLFALALLTAASAFVVVPETQAASTTSNEAILKPVGITPGKVIKMVPQSGVSKSFDFVTENGITLRLQFYRSNVFRVLAAPQVFEPYRDRRGNPVKNKDVCISKSFWATGGSCPASLPP